MCESKENGGRRCITTQVRANMKRKYARGTVNEQDFNAYNARIDAGVQKYGNIIAPLTIDLPSDVTRGIAIIKETGGNPLIVGGTVRDAMRGVEPKDFDIEVHGVGLDDVVEAFKRNGIHVDEVGKTFGVLKVRLGEEDLDISIPRRDSLVGEGHRGFEVETDAHMGVREASSRRDYTINAIMYDPELQVIIDPHHGSQDLKLNILRHVSEAFSEDPLRPLRGVQFAARYNMTLHEDTALVSKALLSRYSELAKERVRTEWMKFYEKGVYPSAGLNALEASGWQGTVPGYEYIHRPAVDNAAHQPVYIKAAVMAANMNDTDAKNFMKATMIGDKLIATSFNLSRVSLPQDTSRAGMRDYARQLGRKGLTIQDVTSVMESFGANTEPTKAAAEREGIFSSSPVSFLTGDDIVETFPDTRSGRWIGTLIERAHLAEDNSEFTSREGSLQWLRAQTPG